MMGSAAQLRHPRRSQHLRGFANTQLIVVLAILAAVSILLQLQTCSFPVGAGTAKKTTSSKRSKAPALIPPAQTPQALDRAADKFIAQRTGEIARIDRMQRETIEAYARMDGKRAANILQGMDLGLAVEILAKLRERDIARILEEAEPTKAAEWTAELLKRPEFTPVPESLRDAAAEAGLYDNLPDLLQQIETPSPTGEDGVTAPIDNGQSPAGAATTEETPAADTEVPGETGAPPAAAAQPAQASPASGPPPVDGGATDPLVLASMT